ncbi:GspE/PulE family protein [Patescibacteria group bacterium]|nr:GspE/PulE family protein [Patescibacteria group bacterium]
MENTSSQKLLGSVELSSDILKSVKAEVKTIADLSKKIESYLEEKTTDLLDCILASALTLEASDIHFEPQEEEGKLRLRLDGMLHDILMFDLDVYKKLASRIKLLSKIKLNISDKPQDGRFSISADDILVEIRTSSLPSEYGESIVMRVLNPKNLMGLDELGLREDLRTLFNKEIQKPNGMIIVTGPTGSGKTTTLYAFLKKIQNPDIKIITIEDPIEYHMQGVSQTQVAPEKGYDFAEGLRSIVRQDPDVILVGEIRDLETAGIALQAALTGHLVLSTLHTNDAAGTIPRLVDLGAESSSIAPALNMAIAQRLVRKVCHGCSIMVKPTAEEKMELEKNLSGLKIKIPSIDKIPKIKGCQLCNQTGYKGRKGVYEAFLIDDEMERFILTNPPISSVKDLAVKKGMVTMYQGGLIDVLLGTTTIEEVKRVIGE